VVFGHQAFLERLARVDLALEDNLGVGRHQKIDGLRRHQADRRVEQAAGTFDFVVAHAEIQARRQLDRRVSADCDGNLQRLPGFGGAPRKERQMVVRRNAHHGGLPVMDGEARERGVAPSAVRIARHDDAGRYVVPRLAFEEARDRQRRQRLFRDDDILDATARHLHGLHWAADRLVYARHDFGNVDAQRGGDPVAAAQEVSGDAQGRSFDILEQERRSCVGGRKERRDFECRIDWLGNAQQRPALFEGFQKRTDGLLIVAHFAPAPAARRRQAVCNAVMLSRKCSWLYSRRVSCCCGVGQEAPISSGR
jgi:hypothetical protein